MKTALVIIDTQYDFHDVPVEFIIDGVKPALSVPGAWEDSGRLAKLILELEHNWNDIVVLMDTHQAYDIAHPTFWVNKEGSNPPPFTEVTSNMVRVGELTPVDSALTDYVIGYIEALELKGKSHFIWPEHCIDGTVGHEIVEPIKKALAASPIDYQVFKKGIYELTEHFGAFEAEIPVESQPSTTFNAEIYSKLMNSEQIVFSGQALTHCVIASVLQFINKMKQTGAQKEVVLLTDTTSPVAGFEQQGQEFLAQLEQMGVKLMKCSEFSNLK
ncbi:hypothetical protein [Vibrio harveyi]|uniref:hypothetical protein n=1 Tax=Vibrio harveyi TaxID=669 RepID=UPI003CF8A43F